MTLQRSLRLLADTGAEMQVLVGEANCPSVEALKDALGVGSGQFQVVAVAAQAHCSFIVVQQPGWEARHQTERRGSSFQAMASHSNASQTPSPAHSKPASLG